MIWISPGFKGPLSREVSNALRFIERFAGAHKEDLYLTHGRDGRHGNGTLHYQGDAVDFLPLHCVTVHQLTTALGAYKGIQIVDESDHYHLEYDPK
jgi:hypothetical protein